jgi:hypothetical protein
MTEQTTSITKNSVLGNPSSSFSDKMARNYSLGVLLAVAALASPFTQAHSTLRIDEGVKQTVTSPIDALSATMPNPVHTWEDKKNGTYYAQNQIFLKNTDATRAVCDVKFTVPVDAAAKTRLESSYVSHVETSRSGLDGSLPEYADRYVDGWWRLVGCWGWSS